MKTSFLQGTIKISAALALTAGLSMAALPIKTTRANVNLPLPDPNSPKSPIFYVNLPLPDPNSPKSPIFYVNLPLPDPNSPKSPI